MKQLLLIFSFICLLACKNPFSTKFDAPKKAAVLPQDELLHPKNSLEWWYLTGVLQDEVGNKFGVEYVFFHFLTKDRVSRVMVNAAITDTRDSSFYFDHVIKRKNKRLNDAAPINFKVEDYSWKGLAGNYEIAALMSKSKAGFNLSTKATTAPVFHSDSGYVFYGDITDAGYFSYPRLKTDGTIVLNEDTIAVSGEMWFDKQWNCGAVLAKDIAWDWTAISLENGMDIMLYRIKQKGKEDFVYGGTYINQEREAIHLKSEDIVLTTSKKWKSPESKKEYPTNWAIKILPINANLQMQAVQNNQELILKNGLNKIIYWEGMCKVEGTINSEKVKGYSYLEMTNK